MRYKKTLNKKQIDYLIRHADLPNQELATRLDTTASIVATQKSRLRKKGIKIPLYSRIKSVL